MMARRIVVALAVVALLAGMPARGQADDIPCGPQGAQDKVLTPSAAISARVDQLLAARWAEVGVQPAPAASDAEFLRRAFLDLTGVIPKPAEVRAFLRDASPDKRARLIEELLHRPTNAQHLANTWRHILLPGEADVQAAGGVAGFQNWLQDQFAANARYDNIVADLLVARGNARQNGPALFYTALELKPEAIAASTSRIFMGVQIQCAQCHNHPFDRWTMQDFWGYAAFFARVQQRTGDSGLAQVVDAPAGEVKYPETEDVALPKYLDASAANPNEDDSRRRQLAIWLVSRDNPYFARAAVNRVWAHLFGRGIVEPVDDFSQRNPPSHPELLDELAAYFVSTGFDIRDLFRTLANTQAYQMSSQSENESADEPAPELFSRMAVKSLSPEQIYDCLLEATRRREGVSVAQRSSGSNRFMDPARIEFIARFQAPTQSATEFQSGIPQALTLMNGRAIAEATDLNQSGLLAALEAPFFTDEQRVEAMFLSTLSRPPTAEEQTQFVEYVSGGGPTTDRRQAIGDVLWALLNSAEFILNH
jgi:hypothetical protein